MVETQLQLSGAFGRDEALAALRGKYQDWIDAYAAPKLYRFLLRNEFFTTDEVWADLEEMPTPQERRVMGALIRGFALKGYIVKTGVFEKSSMPACHVREKAVWRSALFVPRGEAPRRETGVSVSGGNLVR